MYGVLSMSVLSDATEPLESPVTTGRPRIESVIEDSDRARSKLTLVVRAGLGLSGADTEKSSRTARAFDVVFPIEVGARNI